MVLTLKPMQKMWWSKSLLYFCILRILIAASCILFIFRANSSLSRIFHVPNHNLVLFVFYLKYHQKYHSLIW